MPRDEYNSLSDNDDRVHLPAHIVILMVAMMLFFVGVGVVLVYSSITNHAAPPQITPSPLVHVTASATVHASPTAQAAPTLQASPTRSTVPNPYPPHTGNLTLNDPLKDNSKGYMWDTGTFGNGGSCSFTGGSYHVGVSIQGHVLACNAEAVSF